MLNCGAGVILFDVHHHMCMSRISTPLTGPCAAKE